MYPRAMSARPCCSCSFLVAGLLALLPVWRLHRAGLFLASRAGWTPPGSSTRSGSIVGMRFPGPFRLLLGPLLVLVYVAPFVAGPERLARVLERAPARTGA